jgi:phospholipase/carboxylesterase
MLIKDIYEVSRSGAPLGKASKALVLLHGRGDTSLSIAGLAGEFCDDEFHIAVPRAPNGTWYPQSFMAEERLNEPSLSISIANVKYLIDEISAYIPKSNIYVMGFSQGACLALEASTRYAAKYGGVAAFTGGLIGSTINERKYQGSFAGTKVFIGNSDKDPHVPLIRSEQSKEVMEKRGANVTLEVYKGMAHTVSEPEVAWVRKNIFMKS